MTQYVGLDVSLKEAKLHVLDEAGSRVWRGRRATEPAAIAAAVRRYAPAAVRIGLETGPLTTWLWTALTAEGLPMVCLDARHAKKAPGSVSHRGASSREKWTTTVTSRGVVIASCALCFTKRQLCS